MGNINLLFAVFTNLLSLLSLCGKPLSTKKTLGHVIIVVLDDETLQVLHLHALGAACPA
jgi:hypothetical protein